MDEDMAEQAPMSDGGRRQTRPTISHSRRVELHDIARKIALNVLATTKLHERCLLRQMVTQLMPDGEDY